MSVADFVLMTPQTAPAKRYVMGFLTGIHCQISSPYRPPLALLTKTLGQVLEKQNG
jgi:hypothetical protein